MRYSVFLILLASMSLNAGSIRKWVDEEGNVHYGDSPPATAKTEGVRVQSAPSNPGKALPRLGSSGDSDSSDGDATDTAAGSNEVPSDQAKIACDNAREDLNVINNSARIKMKSGDGTTRYMTTEEIEERKSQSEADIKRFCK